VDLIIMIIQLKLAIKDLKLIWDHLKIILNLLMNRITYCLMILAIPTLEPGIECNHI